MSVQRTKNVMQNRSFQSLSGMTLALAQLSISKNPGFVFVVVFFPIGRQFLPVPSAVGPLLRSDLLPISGAVGPLPGRELLPVSGVVCPLAGSDLLPVSGVVGSPIGHYLLLISGAIGLLIECHLLQVPGVVGSLPSSDLIPVLGLVCQQIGQAFFIHGVMGKIVFLFLREQPLGFHNHATVSNNHLSSDRSEHPE